MKFFIDTANLEQIRKAHELGVLDGVTTNPSLMAKENIRGTENCNRHYVEICNIVEGDVSAEVIATDFEGMVREGEVLAALHPRIVVKLPCTAAGIRAVKYFAANSACPTENTSVQFVRIFFAAKYFTARIPAAVQGSFTTMRGCSAASASPSRTIPSKSVAMTSALTSPSTMLQIST